jgi:hypothetical protein
MGREIEPRQSIGWSLFIEKILPIGTLFPREDKVCSHIEFDQVTAVLVNKLTGCGIKKKKVWFSKVFSFQCVKWHHTKSILMF